MATNHSVSAIAKIIGLQVTALYPLFRRHAYYLIATLPQSKYHMLKTQIEKGRPNEDIATLLVLPITLITAAKRLHAKNDYPPSKQLGR